MILLPSDHLCIRGPDSATTYSARLSWLEKYHDCIILVGAIPDRAETEYGWIDTGRAGQTGTAS